MHGHHYTLGVLHRRPGTGDFEPSAGDRDLEVSGKRIVHVLIVSPNVVTEARTLRSGLGEGDVAR